MVEVEVAVMQIASSQADGEGYGGWRLLSIDGTTLDLANTVLNDWAFGRPGASCGESAFSPLRMVSLVENGTRVLFGTAWGCDRDSEDALARRGFAHLEAGMLHLVDRGFFGDRLWKQAADTGAALLWRIKKNADLPKIRVIIVI